MNKRYIVTITDTEGTVWMNTKSFSLTNRRRVILLEAIARWISLVTKDAD